MLERAAIERILQINGVTPTAPDEEIKSVLIRARWHQDDVETALTVLRENTETHKKKVDSFQNVFRSDDRLQPETISSLLGIDVDIPHMPRQQHAPARPTTWQQLASIGLVSIGAALLCLLAFMWVWKIGIFHYGGY